MNADKCVVLRFDPRTLIPTTLGDSPYKFNDCIIKFVQSHLVLRVLLILS